MKEIIVDNFAGGGGASTGIEIAVGHNVDIAINHDPAAVAMHRANHPETEHYTEDIWDVDPVDACKGRPVGLAWFSPDCKHFSKAKGNKPVSKKIRGLSWVIIKWAILVRPRVMMMENVEEIKTWGPLIEKSPGKFTPDPEHIGETFNGFIQILTTGISQYHPAFKEACEFLSISQDGEYAKKLLNGLNYKVEYKELKACDYGAPTIRKRFFLIARCDDKQIIWPEPKHADPESDDVKTGLKLPWKPVSDVLDFNIPCPSIFDTSDEIMNKYGVRSVRPLSENTLMRIVNGVVKFVINNDHPYIVNNKDCFTAYNLIQYHSEQTENVRGQVIDKPILTLDSSNRYGLVASFIKKYYTGNKIQNNDDIKNKKENHYGEVCAFLIKYYGGKKDGHPLTEPCPTVVSKDRIGLVSVYEQDYQIIDIGLRMLTPRELFDSQGFPDNYIIDVDADGKQYPKTEQVARCGNAVCPPIPAALVRANLPELCI